MGMKDKFQDQAEQWQQQAKDKLGETRERAGQRGQERPERQERPDRQQQPERGRRPGDEERDMQEQFDQDYEA
ncbi:MULTISPECIES: hypothetical protein [Streptomyces]|uniref:Uncharacterized protein n=2 Tax=Streptomyces TaxID=1883 RepID=A0A2U9P2Q0_STRAS|nr:hypothetical protein [Streptomyces actuosus]AWT43802.1 hypothetical protein DMT42_16740 [Streptomyces actuosus]MBM4821073.1 hypothetical protein [Streptomyces actuosus]